MSGPSTGGAKRSRRVLSNRTFPLFKPIDPAENSRTFHAFKELPLEIRLEIWNLALPGPRVIDINLDKKSGPITSCPPPALLYVCQESRAILLEAYVRGFTTPQYPRGIYLCPSMDVVLFKSHCLERGSSACSDCGDFQIRTRLGRYADTQLVETIIIWDKFFLSHSGFPAAVVENIYHLQRILPGLKTILLAAPGEWDDFFDVREDIEAVFLDEIDDSRTNHELEFQGREQYPKVRAIREAEIPYLNWSLDGENEPYDVRWDDSVEDKYTGLNFSIWKHAVQTHLTELSLEEQGACFHDFCLLTLLEQRDHFLAYRDLTENAKEEDRYVRNFYGLLE